MQDWIIMSLILVILKRKEIMAWDSIVVMATGSGEKYVVFK